MKILVITHDVNRTGAPIVLLHFLKWLHKNRKNIDVSLLVLKEGALLEEFKAVTNSVHIISRPKLSNKIYKTLGKSQFDIDTSSRAIKGVIKNTYDVIYSNTVVSAPYGAYLKSKIKLAKHVVHIHELQTTILSLLPDFKSYFEHIDHFIAVSNVVQDNLVENWNVPANKMTRVYECSITHREHTTYKNTEGSFVVGGSGLVNWRKGSDLFIQVARYIQTYYPNEAIKFNWVGNISKQQRLQIFEDVKKAKLEGVVDFMGQKPDPFPFFSGFDVFLMTSREDPFPLVCIEVGLLGKPIICFKNAVGTSEVIESNGGGVVVPYLDIRAMAEAIISYKHDIELLKNDGEKNIKAFSKFTPDEICPMILNVLETLIILI